MGLIARLARSIGPFLDRASAWSRVHLVDDGSRALVRAAQFGPSGDDSPPLEGDRLLCVSIPRTGGLCVVAVLDARNEPEAAPGDKRLYARNAAGAPVCTLWLEADGRAKLSNSSGFIELLPNGNVVINNVVITPSGAVTSPAAIEGLAVKSTTNNVTLGSHTHSSSGTGPPVPGT